MADNTDDDDGPEHNSRGLYKHGPKAVNPRDLLARMIGDTHCREPAAEPREARRRNRLYSAREAQRQFLRAIRDG